MEILKMRPNRYLLTWTQDPEMRSLVKTQQATPESGQPIQVCRQQSDTLLKNNILTILVIKKNRVHFTIIKMGSKLTAMIDGKPIEAIDKNGKPIPGFNELPEGIRFSSFYFENSSNSSVKQVGIYVTNIKITQL